MISYDNIMVFDLSTEGLNALEHRIVGITLKTYEEEKIITYRDEKKILTEFCSYIIEKDIKVLIGFNSDKFDIPFFVMRCLKHDIKPIPFKAIKKVDVRRALINFKNCKLEEYLPILHLKLEPSRFRKMHMSLLWEQHIPKLIDFLMRDVLMTWELYMKLSNAGLI